MTPNGVIFLSFPAAHGLQRGLHTSAAMTTNVTPRALFALKNRQLVVRGGPVHLECTVNV